MVYDRDGIVNTIKMYLDGLYEGNVKKLEAAFHRTSSLTWEEGGNLVILQRDEWLDEVRKTPSTAKLGLTRSDQILQVEQTTSTMAFVMLDCTVPPQLLTDYLCLLKVEGRWQIVQKVYSIEY